MAVNAICSSNFSLEKVEKCQLPCKSPTAFWTKIHTDIHTYRRMGGGQCNMQWSLFLRKRYLRKTSCFFMRYFKARCYLYRYLCQSVCLAEALAYHKQRYKKCFPLEIESPTIQPTNNGWSYVS